jgi:hypothetical protein
MGLSGRMLFDSSNRGFCYRTQGSSHGQPPTGPPRHPPPQLHTHSTAGAGRTDLAIHTQEEQHEGTPVVRGDLLDLI